MGRYAHHRTCSVVSQDVIGDPDRQSFTIQWIGDTGTGGDPLLGPIVTCAFNRAEACNSLAELINGRVLLCRCECFNQSMLWCQHHVTGPRQGVGSRGEHRD